MISADTTIGRLLDAHPQLADVLARYHPHFRQLRHLLLRKIMAPRVTVAQAARIAGVETDALLDVLRRATGEAPVPRGDTRRQASEFAAPPTAEKVTKPDVLAGTPDSRLIRLDVREDIRKGGEPFARIMRAVKDLRDGEVLVLQAPFEPIPLYDVLRQRGFAHWTERHAPDDWSVSFYRGAPGSDASSAGATESSGTPERGRTVVIDVRGLEPPEPMRRVLERLDTLAPDERLEVLHDRRPVFLYPYLTDRGFIHETDEPEAGLVRIAISKSGESRAS